MPAPTLVCGALRDIFLPYQHHSAPILPTSPNWAFFLQRLAGILGRPFPLVSPASMLRALITLALVCLLQPAFADERAQTQQQLDATRQDITELKKN